jgi:hypothetical protein
MEAKCTFETSVNVQRTTRRYIPEDKTVHIYRCKNFKCYTIEVTSQYLPEGLINTTEHHRMAFVLAQIRTEDLSNMSVGRYWKGNLLDSIVLEVREH